MSRPSKRYPTLASMMLKPNHKIAKAQTWQQQLRVAEMWVARGVGRINRIN